MKNIFKIVFVYIGLVIGAGFASGREILEFFNLKNNQDITGIIIAGVLFSFVAYVILLKSKKNGCDNFYDFTDNVSGSLGYYIKAFMFLYMFAGFFVMLSAGGSLWSMEFGLDKRYGIVLLTIIVFLVLVFGEQGIVWLNVVLVPLMIVGIILICLFSLLNSSVRTVSVIKEVKNNFLLSALCYVSYNTINAGAVLVPLSKETTDKQIKISAIISGGLLGLLIFFVWITINLYFGKVLESEFPMYDIAIILGDVSRYAYFAVLFMAICTTAVSSGFGVLSAFNTEKRSDRVWKTAVLCLLSAPFASLSFSSLVANVYSAFGFVGFVWLAILIYSFVK